MKVVITLLLMVLSTFGYAQIIKTNQGYLLSESGLTKLNHLARKGKACEFNMEQSLILLEQIRVAKMSSDSASIELQRLTRNLRNDILQIESELTKARHQTELVQADLNLNKERVKKLKRDKILITIGGLAAIAGSVLILK